MLSKLSAWIKIRTEGKSALTLAIFGVFLSIFWWSASSMQISDVQLKDSRGSLAEVFLPYCVLPEAGHVFEFTMKVRKNMFTAERIRIIPDDHFQSLNLNEHDLPLEGLVNGHLDDFERGFSYPLGRFMSSGENTLVLKVRNEEGQGGVNVYTDFLNMQSFCVLVFGLFCLVCALGAPLRRCGMGWQIRCMVFMGLVVWGVYFLITPGGVRNYDVMEHVEYVKHVLQCWSIPNPYEGWEFYQPPLYYFSAAVFWRALTFFWNGFDILEVLHLQSMGYVLGFVFFSFMTFRLAAGGLPRDKERKLGKDGGELILWTGLLTFWPSVVIHAARIGNDSLFYFLSAVTFYFVIKWWLSDRTVYFWWASVFAALDVFTKSSGLILFFLMGFLFLVRWFSTQSRGWRLFIQKTWLAWVIFASVILFSYTGAVFDSLSGKRSHLICGNLSGLSAHGLGVDNKLKTYLGFDAKLFWNEPYTSVVDDRKGRQFFWNYLFKTSLFGEFSFSYKGFVPILARGLSCGLIFIIFFPLVGFCLRRNQWPKLPADLPMAVSIVLFLMSIIIFRISAPFSTCGDFRYILPVLMPVLYFYCTGIDKYRVVGWRWVAWLGIVAGWGFIVSSGIFMISLAL